MALLWRWRFPLTVFGIAAAASLGLATFTSPRWTLAVAPGIALFNLAKMGRARAAVVAAFVGFIGYFGICWAFASRLGLHPGARADLRTAVLLAAGLVAAIFLGGAAKARSEHMAEMMKIRAERARAGGTGAGKRQASEERLRIARELHDVLGHHLSLINVQAGVGLHLMDERPEQARAALTSDQEGERRGAGRGARRPRRAAARGARRRPGAGAGLDRWTT